jgi:hypothetical protein
VPEAVARFAGIWSGEAVDERGSICHTLVVEEVLARGYARVIFSVGTSAAWDERLPWFLRATGRVVDGALRVQVSLPTPGVPPLKLIYRVTGETLQVTQEGDDWPQREPNHPFPDVDKSPKYSRWHGAQTAQEKLDIGFSFGKYAWGPGEVQRYHDFNTFVLAAAMDSFLKRQAGPQRHLWDMVVTDVFRPLGIFQLPILHTQEAAAERRQAGRSLIQNRRQGLAKRLDCQPVRGRALSLVVLVGALSHRHRVFLPDPLYGRAWGQYRHAAAQRPLGLPRRRWGAVRCGHDGAGGRGHPALPLSGGV